MTSSRTITWSTEDCPCCGATEVFPCSSCGSCSTDTQPYEVSVSISGIEDGGCTCTDLNGVWNLVLTNGSYFCLFSEDKTPISCGGSSYNQVALSIGSGTSDNISVAVSNPGGSGTATLVGDWAGDMSCTGIGSASNWHASSPNPTSPCDFTNFAVDSVSVVSYVSVPTTLTASLTSSCPGLDGVSITLTYNSDSERWEGSHDFGDGSGPQSATFTCADFVDAAGYIFEIANDTCSGNTASASTLSYHPFSWGPEPMSNSGCVPASCAAGTYTLEVTVTE